MLPVENFNFPVCLAPMVALSHVALRHLIYEYLPENANTVWPTEMLNSRRLPQQSIGETPETLKHTFDHNLVPQLLANEEVYIKESVLRLESWGAVGIDINMGCPVKKALNHNYGVALMGDINYATKIVDWTVKAAKVPVSVKVRAGLENNKSYLKDFLQSIEAAGASWITLHPRLASEKRRGEADWSLVSEVVSWLKIPVIANGDVQTAEDIDQYFSVSGANAVMIGRALNAKPWLLWQWGRSKGFKDPLGKEICPVTPYEEGREYGISMYRLLDLLEMYFGPVEAVKKFRFHIRMSHMWLDFGHSLISIVGRTQDINVIKKDWLEFFEKPQRMSPKTLLRF
ncbi:MAG: tRNA-dihydrouridine synthase family protein [Bdellovibrionales bacterium]|nr:tRNA-dihydrouridine synthase family protein [Bdellovibrionales bacterium]